MGFEDHVHLAWHTIGTSSYPFGKSKVLSQNRIELTPGFIRVNIQKFIIYQPFQRFIKINSITG